MVMISNNVKNLLKIMLSFMVCN